MREKAIPLMRKEKGLVALHVGKAHEHSSDDLVMVSVWKDLPSMKAFTGEKWKEAVVLPGEAHLLKETIVHHYESFE